MAWRVVMKWTVKSSVLSLSKVLTMIPLSWWISKWNWEKLTEFLLEKL
jgi:hypothetical protein